MFNITTLWTLTQKCSTYESQVRQMLKFMETAKIHSFHEFEINFRIFLPISDCNDRSTDFPGQWQEVHCT